MKTEKTLAVISIFAVILKWLHVPFAFLVLILSLSSLGFLYLFGSFYFLSDKEIKRRDLVLSITWGLFVGIIPIAILFKLNWWPGSGAMLLSGLCGAAFFFFLVYFLSRNAPKELTNYYNNLLARTVVLFSLALILYLTPTLDIIKIFTHNDLEYRRLYIQTMSDPHNQNYQQQLGLYAWHSDSLRAVGKK